MVAKLFGWRTPSDPAVTLHNRVTRKDTRPPGSRRLRTDNRLHPCPHAGCTRMTTGRTCLAHRQRVVRPWTKRAFVPPPRMAETLHDVAIRMLVRR
jgi:hypothetical protein